MEGSHSSWLPSIYVCRICSNAPVAFYFIMSFLPFTM